MKTVQPLATLDKIPVGTPKGYVEFYATSIGRYIGLQKMPDDYAEPKTGLGRVATMFSKAENGGVLPYIGTSAGQKYEFLGRAAERVRLAETPGTHRYRVYGSLLVDVPVEESKTTPVEVGFEEIEGWTGGARLELKVRVLSPVAP